MLKNNIPEITVIASKDDYGISSASSGEAVQERTAEVTKFGGELANECHKMEKVLHISAESNPADLGTRGASRTGKTDSHSKWQDDQIFSLFPASNSRSGTEPPSTLTRRLQQYQPQSQSQRKPGWQAARCTTPLPSLRHRGEDIG